MSLKSNDNDSASLENSEDSSRESGINDVEEQGEEEESKPEEEEGSVTFENFVDSETRPKGMTFNSPPSTSESPGENGEPRRAGVKEQHASDVVTSQSRRRKETLKWQKNRRDELLDKIRQLEDSAYSDSETEDEMDFAQIVQQAIPLQQNLEDVEEETGQEEMDVAGPKSSKGSKKRRKHKNRQRPRYRQAPCKPMLSEWLLEKPEDFEEAWIGSVCPVGKRCIVLASRGKTKIYSRSDQYLGSYKSLLPGGCKYYFRDSNSHRNRGVTILDCIWSNESATFYVIDIICWNSHSCVNCDTDYRQFFLHSKFSENLELLDSSPMNPFPFKPLPFFEAREMAEVMSSPVAFPEQVDGVLLFHREAFYISETNPLCLWILLTQVESLLHISVSPELESRQVTPKNLETRAKQIKKRQSLNEQDEMETLQN